MSKSTQTKKKPALRGRGGRFLSKAEVAVLEAQKAADRATKRAAAGKTAPVARVPKLVEVGGRKHRKESKYTRAVALVQSTSDSTRTAALAALDGLGLKNSTAQNWLRQIRKELNLPAYNRKDVPVATV